jgi:hypothetical protein
MGQNSGTVNDIIVKIKLDLYFIVCCNLTNTWKLKFLISIFFIVKFYATFKAVQSIIIIDHNFIHCICDYIFMSIYPLLDLLKKIMFLHIL